MHQLETFALNCGAKIDKPEIYTSFFPLSIEKYITFHSDSNNQSKNYDYWQDVINIISPIFSKLGISIVQVGTDKDRNYENCVSIKGKTSISQLAYVIKNSLLHFGCDSFPTHLSGGFDIPSVTIFGNNFVNCVKPYFGSKEKQKFIEPYSRSNQKPCLANEDPKKLINSIKPEEIAKEIFNLLNIQFNIPFETVFVGNKYSNFLIQELVPNCSKQLFNGEQIIEIRTDIEYNEKNFFEQLSQCKKTVIVIDKPININILKQFKNNILSIVFDIKNAECVEFLSQVVDLGKNIVLISYLPQDQIDSLKIKYYEFGNINKIENVSNETINSLKKDIDKLYYRSAKLTVSNDKYYYSIAAAKNDVPLKNNHEYQKVIDSPEFWRDLNNITIVKLKE